MSAQLNLQTDDADNDDNQDDERDQDHPQTDKIPASVSKPVSRWRTLAYMMKRRMRVEYHMPHYVFDPDSTVLYYWVGAVSVATVYNAWMIALRIAFPEVRQEPVTTYLGYLDNFTDGIYVIDILFQLRTAYLQDGMPVFDPVKIRKNYASQPYFVRDIIAVIPSESLLFYLLPDCIGVNEYIFELGAARLTRLFKFHVLYRFHDLAESRTSVPHFIRVFRLSLLLAIVIHWIACFYYLLSEYEGLGSTSWVYTIAPEQQRFARKYIVCMYWSAMTLTTIGSNNNPETDLEYIFTGVIFLTGVFVIATVLGNVGDVISSMNANRQEFQARMDHIKMYLTHKRVPASLQIKIKKWAEYSWSRTKATDEWKLLNILPERLRAEVAVHVHLDNLKKVKIFEQCETGFLCELVLKLRSQVYSPGDYICKVGETGREMFIINHGKVEVVVPNPSTNEETVVAVLCEGNYFGEISLLRLDGVQNRRTADVRSMGYSELLCLSRKDLMAALVEYPEAKSALEAQAKKRMKTSLQAKRAYSVDALLRNSVEGASSTTINREDSRGREVSEIKIMIEELKNINKVPGRSLWQLIARCELLQAKVHEKEKEVEGFKRKVHDLERMISTKTQQTIRPRLKIITKQLSQLEGREDTTLSEACAALPVRVENRPNKHEVTIGRVNGDASRKAISHKRCPPSKGTPPHQPGEDPPPKCPLTFSASKRVFEKRKKYFMTRSRTVDVSKKIIPDEMLLNESELPSLNSCFLVNAIDKRPETIRTITEEEDQSALSLTNPTSEHLLLEYLKKSTVYIDTSLEESMTDTLWQESQSTGTIPENALVPKLSTRFRGQPSPSVDSNLNSISDFDSQSDGLETS